MSLMFLTSYSPRLAPAARLVAALAARVEDVHGAAQGLGAQRQDLVLVAALQLRAWGQVLWPGQVFTA